MSGPLWVATRALVLRDGRLAVRRPAHTLLPLVFFVVAASLFPLGVGPEPERLRSMAAGVVWVCALLATMLSLGRLYEQDHADGTLEQLLLSGHPLAVFALGKAAVHWLVYGLPLVLMAPVLALSFGLEGVHTLGVLLLALSLGTAVLSLLGGVGAALTLGARSAGMLTVLLVVPMAVPALIFGAGAVDVAAHGGSPRAHLSLLGALLLLALAGAPWATGAALRLAID